MMVFTIAGSALAASDTVGTYKLSEMVEGEESYGSEYMDLMEAVGMTCMLYISDDGTALLDMFGETQELTWDDSYLTADGESIAYTIDGDQLVLAEGDLSLTFTKISDEIVTPEESAADAGDPFADDADAGVAAVVTAPGEYYAEPLAEGDIGDYHAVSSPTTPTI